MNQQNVDLAIEDFAAGDQVHGFALNPLGFDEYRQILGMFLAAFPDAHVSLEDMVAEGDTVIVRLRFVGTQRGEFQAIPPTGNPVSVSGIAIFRFQADKVKEGWLTLDNLGLLQQLGVISALDQAST